MVGSGVDSESDLEMEDEVSGGENEGNRGNEWSVVENKKRKKSWAQVPDSESERGGHQSRRRKEEFKVMVKFVSYSGSVINPLKLTKALNDEIGLIDGAKTLRDGNLLLFCKEYRQQKKLLE